MAAEFAGNLVTGIWIVRNANCLANERALAIGVRWAFAALLFAMGPGATADIVAAVAGGNALNRASAFVVARIWRSWTCHNTFGAWWAAVRCAFGAKWFTMAVTNIGADAIKIAARWFAALGVGGAAEAWAAILVRVTTLSGVFRLAASKIEAQAVVEALGIHVHR